MYDHHTLPQHYESDEEDISESEGQSSPFDVHKRSPTLDSVMSSESVTDPGVESVERPAFARLLSPFSTGKASRPVSMDTIKRHSSSSNATFVTEPCTIFDHDDDGSMILELPSPDSTTPLQSPILLQPAVYVPSEQFASPRNSIGSSSSASMHSGNHDSDVCVAEQVAYVEHAKPNLILISPTATSPSSDGSVYSNDDEAAMSQPILGRTSKDRGRSLYAARPLHSKAQGRLSALDTLTKYDRRQPEDCEPMSAPAVEASRFMSFRARSMSFSRPQTPVTDTRRRLQKEPPRRPPSAQSTAGLSLFPAQSHSCFPADETRSRSISCSLSATSSQYSLSSSQALSRPESPSPYYPPAYNRSRTDSLYSVCSVSTAPMVRSPLPYRASITKGSSTPAAYSSSSLRAELDKPAEPAQAAQTQSENSKSKIRSKKSMKHLKSSSSSKAEPSEPSAAKSFVGFMLRGKRKSVMKNL
ncbi:hypothetical protein BJX76DRAFT_51208 [Aspergillus varians]